MDIKRISKDDLAIQMVTRIAKCKHNRKYARLKLLKTEDIKEIASIFEELMYLNLKKANENENILFVPFFGIKIEAIYKPSKKKKNNLTGEEVNTVPKIELKASFTRSYTDKFINV